MAQTGLALKLGRAGAGEAGVGAGGGDQRDHRAGVVVLGAVGADRAARDAGGGHLAEAVAGSEGAVKVDGVVIRDPQHLIQPANGDVPISLGSKKHGLVTR